MRVRFPTWSRLLLAATACACSANGASTQTSARSGRGMGSASGSVAKRAYDTVSDSWWIGSPDDPTHTRVIYVFDKSVTCAEISSAGWDGRVTDQTQSIEIKLIGTQPGNYPVATDGRPATGEADANYTLTSKSGTPSETLAKSGTITLDSLDASQGTADGTFDLTFPDGHVAGDFHAIYCKGGHEP